MLTLRLASWNKAASHRYQTWKNIRRVVFGSLVNNEIGANLGYNEVIRGRRDWYKERGGFPPPSFNNHSNNLEHHNEVWYSVHHSLNLLSDSLSHVSTHPILPTLETHVHCWHKFHLKSTMKFSAAIILTSIALVAALPPPDQSHVDEKNVLIPRKPHCAKRNFGCEDGYCWKKCGPSGSWCWLAYSRGTGGWVTCTSDANCEKRKDAACAVRERPHGGCGC